MKNLAAALNGCLSADMSVDVSAQPCVKAVTGNAFTELCLCEGM